MFEDAQPEKSGSFFEHSLIELAANYDINATTICIIKSLRKDVDLIAGKKHNTSSKYMMMFSNNVFSLCAILFNYFFLIIYGNFYN